MDAQADEQVQLEAARQRVPTGAPTRLCGICWENIDCNIIWCPEVTNTSGDGIVFFGDMHPESGYCVNCIRQHVKASTGSRHVKCPHLGCTRSIPRKILLENIPHDVFSEWEMQATADVAAISKGLREELIASGVDFKECPACSFAMEKNGGCNIMVCGYCNHEFPWEEEYDPFLCDEEEEYDPFLC